VFIRYERGDSSMLGVQLGVPTTDDGLVTVPDVTDDELEESTRQRIAEGWDDEAVSQLLGPDAQPELTARLAELPACLDRLSSARS
jgi:hypothetical protein